MTGLHGAQALHPAATGRVLAGLGSCGRSTLYGTTYQGRQFRQRAPVFKLKTTDGTGYRCSALHRSDGKWVCGFDAFGQHAYGTTYVGGSSGYGTVFKCHGLDGLHGAQDFTGTATGGIRMRVWCCRGSTLSGTTPGGGSPGYGTVFQVKHGWGLHGCKQFTAAKGVFRGRT